MADPFSANIYEVFLRAYAEKKPILTLIKDLPRIKELGMNVIWLMPVHPVGEKARKGKTGSPYAIKDYYAIDPALGKREHLKKLVESAHSLEMKVIMDAVLNHTARDSLLVSRNPEFFKQKKGDFYTVNPHWSDVYDLDYSVSGTREYIKKMMSFWVKNFDIDGFRCDVAELVPMDFWAELREELEKLKPGLLFLAEGDKPFLHPVFDISYDGNSYKILRQVLAKKKKAISLARELISQIHIFPHNFVKLRFLENHDQERIAGLVSDLEELEKLIAFFYLMRGAVLVYNGQELGLKEKPDIFNPYLIPWEKGNQKVKAIYKKYLTMRNSNELFQKGEMEIISPIMPPSDDLVVYIRRDEKEWALVAVNFGEKTTELRLAIDGRLPENLPFVGQLVGGKKAIFPLKGGRLFIPVEKLVILRGPARFEVGASTR